MSFPLAAPSISSPPRQTSARPALPAPMERVREVTARVVRYTLFFSLLTSILGLAGLAVMLAYLRFVIPSQDAGNIPAVAVAGLGALAALGVFEVIRSRLMIRHGLFMNRALADDVLSGMLEDAARQSRRGFANAMADLGRIRNFVSTPQVFTFFDCLVTPVFVLAIFFLSPVMGFVVLLAMLVIGFITVRIRRKTRDAFMDALGGDGKNNAFLREALRCREAVMAMGMDQAVERKWRGTREKSLFMQTRSGDSVAGWTAMSKFISLAAPVLLVAIAAWLIINGHMDIFSLIVVKVLAMRAIGPIYGVVGNWSNLREAGKSYASIKELLAEQGEDAPGMLLPAPRGDLRAEQISYTVQGQTLIRGVSLDLQAGEFLGIIGPMAAGKTTLARLLTGVLRPVMGKVSLDGADMFHWDQTRLGRHLGYLPQEVDLFPGAIVENIARMGSPDPEEIARVLALARLDESIRKLPLGLDTLVRKSGADLPGGLRQKIGLARALYGRPCLLVLDEPDANLDRAGVQDLLATLGELKSAGATIVLVTHKPHLLEHADKLLLLGDGKTVHYGPKNQVLNRIKAATTPGPITVKL